MSGGIDSSLVVAIAQKKSEKDFIIYNGFNEASFDEASTKEIAKLIGTSHHEIYFSLMILKG